MIEFKNVTKSYSGNVGLSDVSISIGEGEFVFIVGPSGAGKSTFIKLLMKEIDPDKGKIFFEGRDITKLPKRLIPGLRRDLGIVFQDFRLLPKKTVYENVAFAMEAVHQKRKLIKKQVPHILKLVGISEQAKRYPHELSGGEAQRVAIARAIVNNPKVLIADEPTGNLDPEKSWEIMNLLEQINLRGTTVVMVTHAKDIVDRMGKRVIQISEGSVVRDDAAGFYIQQAEEEEPAEDMISDIVQENRDEPETEAGFEAPETVLVSEAPEVPEAQEAIMTPEAVKVPEVTETSEVQNKPEASPSEDICDAEQDSGLSEEDLSIFSELSAMGEIIDAEEMPEEEEITEEPKGLFYEFSRDLRRATAELKEELHEQSSPVENIPEPDVSEPAIESFISETTSEEQNFTEDTAPESDTGNDIDKAADTVAGVDETADPGAAQTDGETAENTSEAPSDADAEVVPEAESVKVSEPEQEVSDVKKSRKIMIRKKRGGSAL